MQIGIQQVPWLNGTYIVPSETTPERVYFVKCNMKAGKCGFLCKHVVAVAVYEKKTDLLIKAFSQKVGNIDRLTEPKRRSGRKIQKRRIGTKKDLKIIHQHQKFNLDQI